MPSEPSQLARNVRQHLLDLHKALLDMERAEYERASGAPTPPAALLQMLIGDARFAWLRQLSGLVVAFDEALSIRKPAPPETLAQLVEQSRNLVKGAAGGAEFLPKYQAALEASPEAARLNAELLTLLDR